MLAPRKSNDSYPADDYWHDIETLLKEQGSRLEQRVIFKYF